MIGDPGIERPRRSEKPAGRWPFVAAAVVALAALPAPARGADGNDPFIGYAYPAGARAGTTAEVHAGGQNLRGVSGVLVTGKGVTARVVALAPPWNQLDGPTARVVRWALEEARDAITARLAGRPPPPKRTLPPEIGPDGQPERMVPLPDHPFLKDMEKYSLDRLRRVAEYFLRPRVQAQVKRSIGETAILEVTVDKDAEPGPREIRLRTPEGITNPLRFDVSTLPEVVEGWTPAGDVLGDPPVELPAVWNGQLMPKETDRFRFRAKEGQSLVVKVDARHLVPYQPDSVPGWMQAVVAIRDAAGKEVAWADDFRGDPDPVLLFRVPATGEYVLEVSDSIYRGREDFVYRVTVSERPFVTGVYPLGARAGAPAGTKASGYNLPFERLPLDTGPGPDGIRWATFLEGNLGANPVAYAVDSLPEIEDPEPNDTMEAAPLLQVPVVINGRIGKPGDVDWFRVAGSAGDDLVVEVMARRLGSPVDSLLRFVDEHGKVLAWNDDEPDRSMGLETHYADSVLRVSMPVNGRYFVRLSDAQGHGGEEYGYRLRVSRPQPDFVLLVAPSAVNVRIGQNEIVTAYVVRRDGFAGDVLVSLGDGLAGFRLEGGEVPAGRDRVRMTLTAVIGASKEPVFSGLVGRAKVDGKVLERPAIPAEDMMQAFLYRHFVAAKQWVATTVAGGRMAAPIEIAGEKRTTIAFGGKGRVHLRLPDGKVPADFQLDLRDPPKGITLDDVVAAGDGVDLVFRADAKTAQPGYEDNLIVDVYAGRAGVRASRRDKKTAAAAPTGNALAVLPAIPIRVGNR